jgi:hypothetical protein
MVVMDVTRVVQHYILTHWIKKYGLYAIPGLVAIHGTGQPERAYLAYLQANARSAESTEACSVEAMRASPECQETPREPLEYLAALDDLTDWPQDRLVSLWVVPNALAHTVNTHAAVHNLARTTALGGYVYVTMPWIQPLKRTKHQANAPMAQFSVLGLAAVFEAHGFHVVDCLGWGNREHATRMLTDGLFPTIQMQEDLNTYPHEYTAVSLLARRV